MNYSWPLINDNVTVSDKLALIKFLSEPNVRLTQGAKVEEFEAAWSKWLGTKYSVFVNSGASANYIMTAIVRDKCGDGEIIVPPLGWVSDIAPVVNFGMTPVFVDVSLENLAITEQGIRNAITDKTRAIVLVHTLGFNGINQKIIEIAREHDLMLIEDCCESHGATFEGKRVGTWGDMSNFSFYFGHHMTTIEGGMICTDNEELYYLAKLYRSHGMIRDSSDEVKELFARDYPTLNPLFTFAVPGFNMRGTEINAVIGLEQLDRLDDAIKLRTENLEAWLDNLNPEYFFTDFDRVGSSNFSLPLILRDKNKERFIDVCRTLESHGVEYRKGTAGGGNQARQPYLENYTHRIEGSMDNVDHIHDFGLYIGNHCEVNPDRVKELCNILNERVSNV